MCRHFDKLTSTSACRWSQLYLCLPVLLSGLTQGRVVVRSIDVLSADGVIISDKAHSTAIPSNLAGAAGGASALKSSFVLDCVYEFVPSGTFDNSSGNSTGPTPVSPLAMNAITSAQQVLASLRPSNGNSSTTVNASNSPSVSDLDRSRRNSEKRPIVPRVVKWFRNAERTPFYQWIPAAQSRLFHHAYRDLLDPFYKHNDQAADMFRAVRIIHPVKELSGDFSCLVEDDEIEANDIEEGEQQMAAHELLIYDPPAAFELDLDLPSRQLRCGAWTSEEPTSVEIKLFRQDHDVWQMPLGQRVNLNSTSDPLRKPTTPMGGKTRAADHADGSPQGMWSHAMPGQLTRVDALARLNADDIKHLEVDTSRTFICELSYSRLRRSFDVTDSSSGHRVPPPALDHAFQRSVRIVNESPSSNADYEAPMEGQSHEPFWSAALTSGADSSPISPLSSRTSRRRRDETASSLLLIVLYLYNHCK